MRAALKAHVRKGRLVLDEPTDLPEDSEVLLTPTVDDFAPDQGAFTRAAKRELARVIPEGSPTSTSATSRTPAMPRRRREQLRGVGVEPEVPLLLGPVACRCTAAQARAPRARTQAQARAMGMVREGQEGPDRPLPH